MRIEQIELKNCLCFKQLSLKLSSEHNITVILGEQGSGKTALLKQIFHALSWFAGRYKDLRTAGVVMPDADIRRGQRQSKISLSVRVGADMASLPESTDAQPIDRQCFTWHLWKTLNNNGMGLSQVDTAQLDMLTTAYQDLVSKDPLAAAPVIAYYPCDRFIGDLNLLSKNNPAVLHPQAAYDLSSMSNTNFVRFFEWLREISDIEYAQQAQFIQGLSQAQISPMTDPKHIIASPSTATNHHATNAQNLTEHNVPDALQHAYLNTDYASWHYRLLTVQSQLQNRCLNHLNRVLQQVFPEIEAIFLQYQPKLDLMVRRHGEVWLFQQLPNSLKIGIALIGDIFRRACLLNPLSAFPHLEATGIVMIDQIDQKLDSVHCSDFLFRLGQCFPQLQFVVTGQQRELIEHGEHWQCLQLHQQRLQPLNLSAIQQQWHRVYNDLLSQPTPEGLNSPDIPVDDVQSLWTQIQLLSVEQQQQLKNLWGDEGHSLLQASSIHK